MVGSSCIEIVAILLVSAVATAVTRADSVTVRGTEPPHLPLIFDGGLEGEYPLLHHVLFCGGERICVLWCGSGSRLAGCGSCEVVQGGRDPQILFCGGGGEMV